AIGAGAIVTGSNTVSLGRNLDQVKVPGSLNVSGDSILNGKLGIGTNLPETVFHIRGQNNNNFKVGEANCFNGLYKFLGISFGSPIVNCTGYSFGGTSDGNTFINADGNLGTYFYYRGGNPFVVGQYVHAFVPVRLSFLSSQGMDQLCLNIDHEIANCSSSLRYKKDLTPFTSGLSVINRLQPITFRWKGNDRLDLGFGAEDIATIEPLLVTYNADGQVEGVKYDRLSTIFVNAFKEQQTQIEQQQKLIQEQQTQINALLKLVCAANKDAEICKEK
ncbi:MAG TPA: tail fiber domain-containing protein, partial [Pyrinomonadaceae bacterium]|nr:tail fiber domain-containing protein [Pyrinomonadaceae bacterium]